MKKFFLALCALLIITPLLLPASGLLDNLVYRMAPAPVDANGKNLAQQLGYPKDAKLLVVNSDDTGGNPTFTHGIIDVMAKGLVKSTSVIVHDRNDSELIRIAKIAKQHPEYGFGIHLMLTNEYQSGYPWAPVLPKTTVPSLYNKKGLAWEKISEVETNVNPEHAAKEFIAQIQKALDAGINVTHLDSHMGTIYRQSQFPNAKSDGLIMAAIAAAKHFNIPMTINTFDEKLENNMRYADNHGIIRPDTFFGFYELEEMNSHLSYQGSAIQKFITAWVVKNTFGFILPYENQKLVLDDVTVRMEMYKTAVVNVAKPGLNHFFMHAAAEHEQDGIKIPEGKNHAAGTDKVVRLADSYVWSSDEMKQHLSDNNIILINYSQLKAIQQNR